MGKTKIKSKGFGNVFKPTYETTDASRTWAATVFGDATVTVKLCERDCKNAFKAKTRRDKSGNVFRRAFHIAVVSGEKIIIHLYRGATLFDLKRAKGMVKRAQEGEVAPDLWDEANTWNGYKMIAWLGIDPDHYSPQVRPCLNVGCMDDWHTWETRGDEYPTDACVNDQIFTDWYRIYLQQHQGEPWEVHSFSIENDDFEGAAGLEILRRWTNDYAYLQGECDRLNAMMKEEVA